MNLFKFLGVYLYYQGITTKYFIKNLFKKQDNILECYGKIIKFMKTDFEYGDQLPELSQENCIFLCNHRSSADFFIDGYLTQGAAYLGLIKAFLYFPGPCLYAYHCKSMILFVKCNLNRDELYEKTLKMLQHKSIIIYPEGSRNLGKYPLPLKKGFIKMAYNNNIPIQIIITQNKELVFTEHKINANFGVTCKTGRSTVLYPKEYPNLESWIEVVETSWNEQWNRVKPLKEN